MKRKENRIVEQELQNYGDIIKYLIKSYCLNPDKIITANK